MTDAGDKIASNEPNRTEADSKASLTAGPWGEEATFGPAMEVASQCTGLGLVRHSAVPRITSKPARMSGMELTNHEQKLTESLDLHDFSSALQISEAILIADPHHSRAMAARDECRKTLQAMYLARLQDAKAVPHVKLEPDEIIWLGLDHRAGFVLSQVDGISSYEEIIEVSGMDRLECLKILAQLTDVGVIEAARTTISLAM